MIYNGAALSPQLGVLQEAFPDGQVTFRSTVHNTWTLVKALRKFTLETSISDTCPIRHAVLTESNTVFGQAVQKFDKLRLMSSLNDVSGIPTEGKNLIIVAAVNSVLHFRIFDGDGKVIVDTDERKLTEQAGEIEDLRKQLESLWPPHELTSSEEDRPGRPGWLPTQVPHRSGLAHHAHPVPHLMNSRPARSVVVTWTWFRSQCTCQVSLQRLMRRHPLPSTGSLGLVPPLQRYYKVLRLPAAHFAALCFLRLAIPSLRPLFVPPGPGRGAVDQSGVGRRYLQPPCSMEEAGSPKFPEEPL